MGRLSDQKRSAGRPGQRERKRVKRTRRAQVWTYVTGVGKFHAKFGRKKAHRVFVFLNRMRVQESRTPSIGEQRPERRDQEVAKASLSEQSGQDRPTHP